MKAVKIAVIAVLIYVAIVVAFESMIGFTQPMQGDSIRITTFDESGAAHDRVVSRLDSAGQIMPKYLST